MKSLFKISNGFRLSYLLSTLFLLAIVSCTNTYTVQYFSFPEGSDPYKKNWDYLVKVAVYYRGKPSFRLTKKTVRVRIVDKGRNVVGQDAFTVKSARIDARVRWERFEDLRIDLMEVGVPEAEDGYNRALVKTGPVHRMTVSYAFSPAAGSFRVMSVVKPGPAGMAALSSQQKENS